MIRRRRTDGFAAMTAKVVTLRGNPARGRTSTSVRPSAETPPAVESYATSGTPKRPGRSVRLVTAPPDARCAMTAVRPLSVTVR